VLSGLLYLLLSFAGKRTYRRFAFPGILDRAGTRVATQQEAASQKSAAAKNSDPFPAAKEQANAAPVLATIWRRLLAGFLDFLVFLTLGVFAIGFVIFAEDMLNIASGTPAEDTSIFGFWLLFDYLYQSLAKRWLWHGTLGDLACGLSVTDRSGRRLGFSRISARYLVRALPWLVAYGLNTFVRSSISNADSASTMLGGEIVISFLISALAVVTVPFTKRRQTVYDMIVRTLVVRRPNRAKPLANRFDSAEAA